MKPPSDKMAAKKEQVPEISEFCRLLAKVLRRSCQATEPTADGASSQGDRATEPSRLRRSASQQSDSNLNGRLRRKS